MSIEAILDQCLEEIRQGQASLPDCLARHPEQAKELEPLLRAALAVEQMPDLKPSAEWKRGLRERIMNFDKPEETDPIRNLLSHSDAGPRSEEQGSTTSVPSVPAKKTGS